MKDFVDVCFYAITSIGSAFHWICLLDVALRLKFVLNSFAFVPCVV
jgi:hypothetical protein